MAGKVLHLNGFGLRTYSWLGIHIYVAALYLEDVSSDATTIIGSPETKLLTVRFERDINSEQARNAWRDGFAKNCENPCHLDAQEEQRFLSKVPAMRAGETFDLLFTRDGVDILDGGQTIGEVADAGFAGAMLSVFLGPRPASEPLKAGLLRGHE